jgi:hypothetical protein
MNPLIFTPILSVLLSGCVIRQHITFEHNGQIIYQMRFSAARPFEL